MIGIIEEHREEIKSSPTGEYYRDAPRLDSNVLHQHTHECTLHDLD